MNALADFVGGVVTDFVVERLDLRDFDGPSLLKTDVRGSERAALEGCDELLVRFDWIYSEGSFVQLYEGQALADAVNSWLRERRLALAGVYNMSCGNSGRAVQADVLFRRVRSHAAV